MDRRSHHERVVDLRMCADRLEDLRTRPVGGGPIPYLFVEVTPTASKGGRAATSEGLVVIRGTRAGGGLEVVAVAAGDVTNGGFWEGVVVDLVRRGLHGTRLIMSPDLPALRETLERMLPDTRWERLEHPSDPPGWSPVTPA